MMTVLLTLQLIDCTQSGTRVLYIIRLGAIDQIYKRKHRQTAIQTERERERGDERESLRDKLVYPSYISDEKYALYFLKC